MILTCIEPDITDSASNFVLMVVLIELVNVFNEPVLVSIESTRFFKLRVVVATDELKLTIDELNPNVVVAIDEDKLPIELDIEELNIFVVIVTPELKELILELKSDVVVATEEDNEPILELNPLVVVATEEDIQDALKATQEYRAAGFKGNVYLMPVGGVESVYTLNNKTVALAAMKYGLRYSDRLQVPLFKNEWGT